MILKREWLSVGMARYIRARISPFGKRMNLLIERTSLC